MSVTAKYAEILRSAARLMEERAKATSEAPNDRWTVDSSPDHGLVVGSYTPDDVSQDGTRSTSCVAFFAYPGDEDRRTYNQAFSVATHMAAWQPVVAVMVAAWLEDEACRIDDTPYRVDDDWIERNHRAPLAVARAYLEVQP